jgi:hypothetical protein
MNVPVRMSRYARTVLSERGYVLDSSGPNM